MDTGRATRRRNILLITIGIVIAVIVVSIFVYNLVIQAKVTVTAPEGSTITISRVVDGSQVVQKKTTSGRTTIGLSPANYAITVDNAGISKQLFYTTTRAFQDKQLVFDADNGLHAATVSRHEAYDVISQGSAVNYLDTTRRAIVHIANDGTISVLDNAALFGSLTSDNPGTAQGIYPIANNRAIVLTNSNLYVLQNNRLTPIDMAGLPSTSSPIMVGTNPTQESFVAAINQTLYYYSTPSATPQKLLDLDKRFDQVAYGGDKAIVYSTRMPLTKDNIRSAYGSYAIDPIVIDTTAKTQKVLTGGPAVSVSLSPDGRYATIEPQAKPYTTIYDINQNVPLYTILSPDTTMPAWFDNTHFVYGKGSDVWKFDVTSHTGTALGTVPDGLQPTSVTFNSENGIYYVTTYQSEDTATIFSLSTTSADPNAERAASLDTTTQNNSLFTLNYIDVSQPTIRVLTNVISNNPSPAAFKTLTLHSRQAALDYISSKGVDPNKLTIVYDPSL